MKKLEYFGVTKKLKSHIDAKWLLSQLGYKLTCDKNVDIVKEGEDISSGINLIGIVFWVEDNSFLGIKINGDKRCENSFSYYNKVAPYQNAYNIPDDDHVGMYSFTLHGFDSPRAGSLTGCQLSFDREIHIIKIYEGYVIRL